MPEATENSVILCHLGPSPAAPTISTFVLKVETYLRMTEIPYEQEFTFRLSSKGKMPYVKHNGKEIADSNFIIPYLNEKFEKDLDAPLSESEKAISLAFKRLIEENLYWTLVHANWLVNYPAFSKQLPVSGFRKTFLPIAAPLALKPKWRSMLHAHGMGRHSKAEIYQIMEKDLQALSTHLGDQKYFMGSESTEIDATLFGHLACFIYASPGSPHGKLIREKLTNLLEYTNRLKAKYFPDWDEKCRNYKKKQVTSSTAEVTPKEPLGKIEEKPEEKQENGSKVEDPKANDVQETSVTVIDKGQNAEQKNGTQNADGDIRQQAEVR